MKSIKQITHTTNAPFLTALTGPNGNILEVSENWTYVTGLESETIIGTSIQSLFTEQKLDTSDFLKNAPEKNKVRTIETQLQDEVQNSRWFELEIHPILEKRNLQYFEIFIVEITKWKKKEVEALLSVQNMEISLRREQALSEMYFSSNERLSAREEELKTKYDELKKLHKRLESQQKFLTQIESVARLGGISLTNDDKLINLSEEFYRIFRWPKGSSVSLTDLMDAIHEDYYQDLKSKIELLKINGKKFDIELLIITEGGFEKWVRVLGYKHITSNEEFAFSLIFQDNSQLKHANERISLHENAVNRIQELLSTKTGQDCFKLATKNISELLNADGTFVGEYIPSSNTVQTLSKYKNGTYVENRTFKTINTAIGQVIKEGNPLFSNDIQEQFPKDKWLTENNVNALVGFPLTDHKNQVIGVFVLTFKRRISEDHLIRTIVNIFSARLSIEMERKTISEALQFSQKRYKSMVEGQKDFMIRWTPNGTLTFANESFSQYVNISKEKLMDRSLLDFFSEKDLIQWNGMVSNFQEHSADSMVTTSALVFNHHIESWIEWNHQPLIDNNGKIIEIMSLGRDVTERQNTKVALEKANKELDQLLYSLSHDFRGPISTALGLVQISTYEQNIEGLKYYMHLMEQSLAKLEEYLKNVSIYSYNNRLESIGTPVDFEHFTQDCLEQFDFLSLESGFKVHVDLNQSGPFLTDLNRLRIIFTQLIDNGIKFRKDGSLDPYLKITIGCDSKQATIVFEDNGIGIRKEHHGKVFDMFYRASLENHGSGLGLYIVKETIKRLGGDISLTSNGNQGCRFVLHIPTFKVHS